MIDNGSSVRRTLIPRGRRYQGPPKRCRSPLRCRRREPGVQRSRSSNGVAVGSPRRMCILVSSELCRTGKACSLDLRDESRVLLRPIFRGNRRRLILASLVAFMVKRLTSYHYSPKVGSGVIDQLIKSTAH